MGDTLAETPQASSERDTGQGWPVREALGIVLGLAMLVVVFYHGEDLVPNRYYQHRIFGWFGLNFICLFMVPALLVTLVWRQRLNDYGLQWGRARTWAWYLLFYAVIVVPAIVIASRAEAFQSYYPRYGLARDEVSAWLLAFLGWGVYFFAWEFFFRGFLLQLVARRYGAFAIIVQTVPFVMMHFNKPELECWAAIIAGLALGVMAYRGRSCVGTWLLHWGCATLMDLLVVLWPSGA